jgi:hypothetical protein
MAYNNEICKGCWVNIWSTMKCMKIPIKGDKVCPCINCIVKSMCSEICKEFLYSKYM